MKTTTVLLTLILSANLTFAIDGKYLEAMNKNIQAVYTAQNITDLQNTVNTFERIGAAEKTKWEPFYYAAFGYVMMANKEKDNAKKDAYLDLASADLEKAKTILPDDSELTGLEGFIHMIRVTVDPATRGQEYSTLAMQAFGKAMTLNPENPRPIALMAQMKLGTANFLDTPIDEACALAAKASEKFSTYKSDNLLAPQWGREMNEGLKSQCQ